MVIEVRHFASYSRKPFKGTIQDLSTPFWSCLYFATDGGDIDVRDLLWSNKKRCH